MDEFIRQGDISSGVRGQENESLSRGGEKTGECGSRCPEIIGSGCSTSIWRAVYGAPRTLYAERCRIRLV